MCAGPLSNSIKWRGFGTRWAMISFGIGEGFLSPGKCTQIYAESGFSMSITYTCQILV